jgi:hypothetical protein
MYDSIKKASAVWTKVATIGTVNVSLSDGGSIKFQTEGQGRAFFMSPVSQLSSIVQVLQALTPEQLHELEQQGLANKDRKQVTKKVLSTVERASQYQQAAIDQLVATGMSVEQAKQVLRIA